MFLRLVFLSLLTFHSYSAWCSKIQTETHTYILSQKDKCVLAIDRQTDKETKILLGTCPQKMLIDGDTGYVVGWYSGSLSVIDLKTQILTKSILVGGCPKEILVHKSMAYILEIHEGKVKVVDLKAHRVIKLIDVGTFVNCLVRHKNRGYVVNGNPEYITVIDLETHTVAKTISLEKGAPMPMVIHGDVGYVLNWGYGYVAVIDLNTQKVVKKIPTCFYIDTMVIHQDTAYITCPKGDCVFVIDLKKETVLKKLEVGKWPQNITIYKDMAYVLNQSSNSISVIDLKTHTVTQTIFDVEDSDHMVVCGCVGYVVSRNSAHVDVVDLTSNLFFERIYNSWSDSIGFSDTGLYVGLKKVAIHSQFYPLFESPYMGIPFSMVDQETGEQAFQEFIKLKNKKDYLAARPFFETALSAGHPMAYAVAAYAFLHKKRGAGDPNSLFWYYEFSQSMDRDYYKSLCNRQGIIEYNFD